MNSVDRLFSSNFMSIMTNTKRLATIFILTAIMITGGFVISPYAYSSGGEDDDHEPDPCDCEKPDRFTVSYIGPGTEDNPAIVEIYKKTEKIGENDPLIPTGIEVFVNDFPDDGSDLIVLSASDFNKDKLGSNVGYRILWDIPEDEEENPIMGLVEIARIDIHTSCSKLLFIGQTFTGGEGETEVTLTVEDGTRNGITSIPQSNPDICEEEQKPTPMASITVKKAITNDNGGTAISASFEIILTNVDDPLDVILLAHDLDESMDPLANVNEVPAGTYKLSENIDESITASYTTVLIAGDTACPSMVDEPFKLKKGKHISCIIYNDDNGDGTSGGEGVAFGFNGFQFNVAAPNGPVGGTNTCATVTLGQPCIEKQGILYIIVDPLLDNPNNSIVLWSLTPLAGSPVNQVNNCALTSIIPSVTFPSQNGYALFCSTFFPGTWNINYAFIETDI